MKKKNDIKINLYGNPLSSQAIYRRNGMVFYITREARAKKENYIEQVRTQYKGPIIDCPLMAIIKLYFGDRRKRDWDNFHKLTLDSLQGIVIKDDAQIQKAVVEKEYDKENPRCEIKLKIIGE